MFKLRILYHLILFKWRQKNLYNEKSILNIRNKNKKKWVRNLKKSSFYKGKSEFPIINKKIFMDNFDLINTVGILKEDAFKVALEAEESRDFSSEINNITIGLSSGTSGNKGIFLASPREKAIWVASIVSRVIGFSFKRRTVAFFLRANSNLYESTKSKSLSFNFFDLKSSMEENLIDLVKLSPNILVAQPSVLVEVANYYKTNKITSSFEKIISVAEVLENDQKRLLKNIFKINIDQVYQCTEGFLAYTCKEGNLHFNDDWLFIEKKYLDKEKRRFHPIITDYLRYSQPLVRYELNDVLHEMDSCPCGLKSLCIEKIEGRSDDVFTFKVARKKIKIFPDFIRRAIITSSDNISNYQVIKYSDTKIGVFFNSTKANRKEDFARIKVNLINLFESFGIKNDINIIEIELDHKRTNKLKRIKNAN